MSQSTMSESTEEKLSNFPNILNSPNFTEKKISVKENQITTLSSHWNSSKPIKVWNIYAYVYTVTTSQKLKLMLTLHNNLRKNDFIGQK